MCGECYGTEDARGVWKWSDFTLNREGCAGYRQCHSTSCFMHHSFAMPKPRIQIKLAQFQAESLSMLQAHAARRNPILKGG